MDGHDRVKRHAEGILLIGADFRPQAVLLPGLYYEGVTKMMGGQQRTEDFFRLFLIPGVHHCGGGPGLTDFDALTLLENWVEKGHAPDVLIARLSANGAVERSRPVYPYPIRARYLSTGDPKQAASFGPVDPSRQ